MDITLALGGGGAKGNAHIGIIRRLEQEGFKVKAIAGTSFGGVVAIFYALGYSADQIEDMFAGLNQRKLYGHEPNEGPSLLGLAGVTKWLKGVIGSRTFSDLKIPCVLTSADLRSGKEALLSSGFLVEAILATVAVPGIFPSRHVGDLELVDGGTLNPVPVAPARSLKPDLPVVAVSLTTLLGVPAQTWSLPLPDYVPRTLVDRLNKASYTQALDVFLRSLDMVTRAVTEYRLVVDKPDVILRPDVVDIDILDRVNVRDVARRGEEAVNVSLPELYRLFAWHTRLRRVIGF